MKRTIARIVVLMTFVGTATAQEVGQRRDGDHGRGVRGRGPSIRRIVDRRSEQIEFDAEQTARIDEIVAAHEERMEELRAQRREVRAAMEAGDEERAAELREQFLQQREEGGGPIQALFDEIAPVLHEDQREAFRQFRDDFAQRQFPGERGRMRQMFRDLPDALNMTEDQRREFGELLATQREMMRERVRQRRQQGEEGRLEESGRPARPDFDAMRDEMFEQVAEILNDDQLELLAEYWVSADWAGRTSEQQESDDLRLVLLAAKRVRGLSREQHEAWRQITRDAMRSSRDLRRTDRNGKATLAAAVKAKVVDLLEESQREEFEQNLERLKSRQKGGQRERGARRGKAEE